MATKSSAKEKYLFVESDNSYSTVLSPLKSTQRIKYTSFDVSPSFLVFGATSGGLYVFRREPCTFIQLLPNKEGSVSHVAISPDEKLIAFASVRGTVCVLQRAETGSGTRCLNRSTEHNGSSVTAMCWVDHSDQVFVGDNQGRLSVINISLFMSKNMFQVPAFVFMQVDSAVVSICCHEDRLLVSSYTRCYVCDTAREQYRQVGTKLRDGQYGACYVPSDPVRIYCARPGSRLWEVDGEGVVQCTHQLKHLLAQPPEVVVHHACGIIVPKEDSSWPEQSFNFAQLYFVMDKFLLTFKHDGVYIFDPKNVVLMWSNCYKDIVDCKYVGDIVYVWCKSQEIHALQITPLDKCLLRLYFYKHYDLCSDLCLRFSSIIVKSDEILSKLGSLLGLKEILNDTLSNELQDILKLVELHVKERELSLRLESGIFLVDNHHARWQLLERSKSVSRSNQRSGKSRNSRSRSLPSHSQSRKVRQESPKKFVHNSRRSSASTISLPEFSKTTENDQGYKTNNTQKTQGVYNQLFCPYEQLQTPQIFPLSSPDIIHDALVELGNSVSGKLVSSTKSLLDKWYKTSNDSEPLDVRREGYVEPIIVPQTQPPLTATEEEIVKGQNRYKSRHNSIPIKGVSELLDLCKNTNSEVTIKLLENLFAKVSNLHDIYIMSLVTTQSNNVKNIVFPFSQCLSKEQFLVIVNIFHSSFKNRSILQWLYNQQCNLDEEIASAHPLVLKEVYSKESLEMDLILSDIMKLFSEVLDPYNILEYLASLGLVCTYLSWCVVMDRFQEGTFRYITKHGESEDISCTDWPYPLLLNAIYLSLRLEQVNSSVRLASSRNVPLETVSYILLKLVSHLKVTGMTSTQAEHKCNSLLLSYIYKEMAKNTEMAFTDKGLVSHIESAFDQINSYSAYGTCHCAFPLPGASVRNAKFAQIGEKLISYHWEVYKQHVSLNGVKPDLLSHTSRESVNSNSSARGNDTFRQFLEEKKQTEPPPLECLKNDSESIKHIMKICSLNPNLLLWTLNNKATEKRFSLQLVVQLGLVVKFESMMENDSEEWWHRVIGLNVDVKKGKCCACSTQWPANRRAGFQWSWLATAALRHLGPQATLRLLKIYSRNILPGELDRKFYEGCIVSSLVDSRTDGLRTKVLDILHRTSDSKDKRAIMSSEAGAQIKSALEEDVCLIATNGTVSSANHHWGISVDLATGDCALCSLSLGAPRLLSDAGLRMFPCSHTFHQICLCVNHSLLYCPLCTR